MTHVSNLSCLFEKATIIWTLFFHAVKNIGQLAAQRMPLIYCYPKQYWSHVLSPRTFVSLYAVINGIYRSKNNKKISEIREILYYKQKYKNKTHKTN